MKAWLKIYYLFERLFLKISLQNDQQKFTRNFMGHKFICQNKWSYLSAIKEIYIDECYKISDKISVDSILDIGANLGFSIAYFKRQFPSSSITAFEADPEIYDLLKQNVENNHFSNITILNGAAWVQDGILDFFQDHAQGGSILQSHLHKDTVKIVTFDIRKTILESKWDLLKIDIEGAEIDLLKHINRDLKKFKLVFIEYHENKNTIGNLSEILKILEENDFKYSISSIFGSKNLFNEYKENAAFNMQLNIHAVRKDQIHLLKN